MAKNDYIWTSVLEALRSPNHFDRRDREELLEQAREIVEAWWDADEDDPDLGPFPQAVDRLIDAIEDGSFDHSPMSVALWNAIAERELNVTYGFE